MEGDSDADNQNRSNESKRIGGSNPSNEGQQSKPKRQMKTPFQLETLEKAYALETYPSEATRAELSEKLGLSDRQLQMWFCHRRLKDKKERENPPKKLRKGVTPVVPDSPVDELKAAGPDPGSDYGSGSGSGSSPYMMEMRNTAGSSRVSVDDMPMIRRSYESQQSIMELRAIACVEAQLGEPLREDGPILGMEFDPLPPDAFGAPIATTEQHKRSGHLYESKMYENAKSNKGGARSHHEFQSHHDQPYFHGSPLEGSRARALFVHGNDQFSRAHGAHGQVSRVRVSSQLDKPGHLFASPNRVEDSLPQRESSSNNRITTQPTSHQFFGTEDNYASSDVQTFNDDVELQRKRKSDEARIAREAEANEIRIRKELERQDIIRRKNEERIRKDMEKQERERRKEEERLMRERQREEERLLREQRREMERRQKFLQKEHLRAEKRRLKEELRMEKQAARRKVAMEKATARKIAKESMDLIEDEQLELMSLAAASKGLPSIVRLDYDTLENLEAFRDCLCVFPPKSVQLKKPFAAHPWIDSEENVGNLLMVWRFFITFADVLGLWPFTLDEFVQAFHDYDSRLLSEVHVALLKLIIKDIEDVARTPTGLGMNQYCSANPEGGHPRIIEGAYAWGFDIRNWQQHLNPLTWPEILRQLTLSAGFGPQLKKRSSAWPSLEDNKREGKGCEDVISNIRSGSAAENAFAWMREKGLLHPRRPRHKLTPGTVKFAAFHVLSLEGSKGLTVLELAEKIQKSGLRDLTTSKTPEASISVALTRDTKLFERIAPSTYCVRPPYRKDPADAEAILAEARKKIKIFENGFLGEEDVDDVEREDDSECEVDEDPEVEDLATPPIENRNSDRYDEANACMGSRKDNIINDVPLDMQNEVDKDFSSFSLNGSKDASCPTTSEPFVDQEEFAACGLNQENVEIDESKPGETWIQGLVEGDYSHLSVEERLNALVALIGIANEGNSIRAVLEDRLEAANALKKQMWAEAQGDKSRLKEEMTRIDFTSSLGGKVEAQLASSAVEGSLSPLPTNVDNKDRASSSIAEDQKPILGLQVVQDPSMDNLTGQQGYASKRSRSQLKAYIAHRAEEMYVYRSLPLGQDRRRNRYWQFVASASRNDPCSGRIFVELHEGKWRLIDTEEAFDSLLTSLDTRGVRESHLRIMLQRIETSFKENVQRQMHHASTAARSGLTIKEEADVDPSYSASFDSPDSAVSGLNSDSNETSSTFRIELGRNETEKKSALARYQDFQRWMWNECFNSLPLCALKSGKMRCKQLLTICDLCLGSYFSEDAHCPSCHQIFNSVNNSSKFSEHYDCGGEKMKLEQGDVNILDFSFPLGIRLLKALVAVVEASAPPEALESCWTDECRKAAGTKLITSSSAEDLLQIMTFFESVIKRQYLSPKFETTKELLCMQSADPSSVPVLPWIPKTIAAAALRLLELDSSIAYTKEDKAVPFEDAQDYDNIPSRFLPLKNKEVDLRELDLTGHTNEEYYTNLVGNRKSQKRGRGNRDQGSGRKYQRKTPGSREIVNNSNYRHKQVSVKVNGSQGRKRGRRTVRKRPERRGENGRFISRTANAVVDPVIPSRNNQELLENDEEEEGWGVENVVVDNNNMEEEDVENSNSADEAVYSDDNGRALEYDQDDYNGQAMEYEQDDDNGQAMDYEQGNWDDRGFDGGASNGWNRGMMMEESDDEDVEVFGDDHGIEVGDVGEEVGYDESEAEVDSDNGSDRIGNREDDDSEYSD